MPPEVALPAAADWLAILGEPTRLGILVQLAAGAKTVAELADVLNTPTPNLSHHLRLLKDGGFVDYTREEGRFLRYRLVGAKVGKGEVVFVHPTGVRVMVPVGTSG
jgi:ArsR family transcriptional regulator